MATLTVSYDPTYARITLTATALPAAADVAWFETSTDQIHWTTVRGGSAVAIVAASASLFDYEFIPGVVNYYRVSAVDTGLPTFVASSTAVVANNAAVTPALPGGYAEGDTLVIWAAIRNSGTGAVVCPAGWNVTLQTDNIALFGKRAAAAESVPTVAITGGAAGADVIAQMACFRNLERTPAAVTYQKNPVGQNIDYPVLAGYQSTWTAVLYLGWKQTNWTSVATVTGATAEIGETSSTAGTGAGLVWDYQLLSTPAGSASGAFTVTGGTTAISYGAAVALRRADYVTRTTAAIVPNLAYVWLKFPAAPYLNRQVILTDWAEFERTSRIGNFSIVSRRDALAVTDFASPRTVTVSLWADSLAEIAALDLVLSVGGVMYLHVPNNVQLRSGYFSIGTYTYLRPSHDSRRAAFTVPLTEVMQPDLALVGNESTWATLVTNYTDWTAAAAANATWTSVLALRGSPADALVGH
jgi:hypothetical protein